MIRAASGAHRGDKYGPERFADASTFWNARTSRYALGKDTDRLVGGRVGHPMGVLLLIHFVMPINAAYAAEFAQEILQSGNRLFLMIDMTQFLAYLLLLLVAVTIVRLARYLPILKREDPFALLAGQGLAEQCGRSQGHAATNYTHALGEVIR